MIMLPPRIGEPDPYWDSVVLCINMQGLNGGSAFRDEKGKSLTPSSCQTSSAESKFGGTSWVRTTTGGQLQVADSADFDFGTGDGTIEGWGYNTSGTGDQRIWSQQHNNSPGLKAILLRRENSGKLLFYSQNVASVLSLTSTNNVSISTWHFFSYSRQGTNHYLHVDGALEASTSASFTFPDVPRFATIGYYNSDNAVGNSWTGYIGPIRITKGIGRYGSGIYTPPKGPFPTFGP